MPERASLLLAVATLNLEGSLLDCHLLGLVGQTTPVVHPSQRTSKCCMSSGSAMVLPSVPWLSYERDSYCCYGSQV